MSQSSKPFEIYQLRIALRGISPMVWRRVLVGSDTTIAELHATLQIVFGWNDEYLNCFHIHGKDYGCAHVGGMIFEDDPNTVHLADFRLCSGERFSYAYDFIADWICDIRLEAALDRDPKRHYPVCIGGKGIAPPEYCRSVEAYREWLYEYDFPTNSLRVVSEVIERVLKADEHATFREVIGDPDAFGKAVDDLETYQQFQPQQLNRRSINAQLRARSWKKGGQRATQSAGGDDFR